MSDHIIITNVGDPNKPKATGPNKTPDAGTSELNGEERSWFQLEVAQTDELGLSRVPAVRNFWVDGRGRTINRDKAVEIMTSEKDIAPAGFHVDSVAIVPREVVINGEVQRYQTGERKGDTILQKTATVLVFKGEDIRSALAAMPGNLTLLEDAEREVDAPQPNVGELEEQAL